MAAQPRVAEPKARDAGAELGALLAFMAEGEPLPLALLHDCRRSLPAALRRKGDLEDAAREYLVAPAEDGPTALRLESDQAAHLRGGLDVKRSTASCTAALRLLRKAFPTDTDDPSRLGQRRALIAHVLAAVRHADILVPDSADSRWLRDRAALHVADDGDDELALTLARAALRDGQRYDPTGMLTGTHYRTVAVIHNRMEERHVAERYLGIALEIHSQSADGAAAEQIADHLALADTFHGAGTTDGVLAELEKATRLADPVSENDPPDLALAACKARLARGWASLHGGDQDMAMEYFRRARELGMAVFGEGHLIVGGASSGIGQLLQRQPDRKTEACEFLRTALEISEAALGRDHLDVGVDHSNLGSALHDAGDHEGARRHLEAALEIAENADGTNAFALWVRHRKLSALFFDLGDLARSRDHTQRVVQLAREVPEATDQERLSDLSHLTRIRTTLGEIALAGESSREALAILEASEAPPHDPLVAALHHVSAGQAARADGDLRTASRHYRRALDLYRTSDVSPERLSWARIAAACALQELATETALSYEALGDTEQAASIRARADEQFETLLGRELATDDIGDLAQVAHACIRSASWDGVRAALGRAGVVLDEKEDASADDRMVIGLAWHNLGRACARADQESERALDAFDHALALVSDLRLQGVVLHDAGAVRRDRGEGAEAVKLFRRAAECKRAAEPRDAGLLRDLGTTLHAFGRALERQGNDLRRRGKHAEGRAAFEEALAVYRERLEALESLPVRDQQLEAVTLHDLADVEQALGTPHPTSTIEHYRRAADLKLGGGADPQDLAVTLLRLGRLLERTGQYEQALDVYAERLRTLQSMREPAPGEEGVALHDLGDIEMAMQRSEQAARRYQDAVERKRADGGDGDPTSVAISLAALAQALLFENRPEEARAAAWEAQGILRADDDAPAEPLLVAAMAVADASAQLRDAPAALEAIADAEDCVNEGLADYAATKAWLMLLSRQVLATAGDKKKAARVAADAGAFLREWLESLPPDETSWDDVAMIGATGESVGAADVVRAALEQARKLPPDHERLAGLLLHVGRMERGDGELDKAWDAFTERLTLLEAAADPDAREVGVTLHDMANVELARKDPAAAVALYRRAADVKRHADPPIPRDLATTLISLGKAILESDFDSDEVIGPLDEALRITMSGDRPDRERIREIDDQLAIARRGTHPAQH